MKTQEAKRKVIAELHPAGNDAKAIIKATKYSKATVYCVIKRLKAGKGQNGSKIELISLLRLSTQLQQKRRIRELKKRLRETRDRLDEMEQDRIKKAKHMFERNDKIKEVHEFVLRRIHAKEVKDDEDLATIERIKKVRAEMDQDRELLALYTEPLTDDCMEKYPIMKEWEKQLIEREKRESEAQGTSSTSGSSLSNKSKHPPRV
eukprot:maker-scaffold178_size283195-snap-gene-1.33 protein:Tk10263 transcript:maker-scaffold178_size283195-snap-gene-1.33-mRNA-1 annotation:"na+ pi-cotransporter family protein"